MLADGTTPGPEALVPELDERQLDILRRLGRNWSRVAGAPDAWLRALPIDASIGAHPAPDEPRPSRFFRLVPVSTREAELPPIEATSAAEVPPSHLARIGLALRRVIIGPPLRSTAIVHERMRNLVALPVLSADALASVAYGPEAMLAVLVLAGAAGLRYSLPIAAAIVFLMLAVGISYRQTIRAYPHGGGSYTVASENLGRIPGLLAAAGLMTDYILDVALSVAAGVAAITSAIPGLRSDTVTIGVAVIAVLLAGNLRGVRQAGAMFAAPTYAFIIAIFAMSAVGLLHAASRGFHPTPPPPLAAAEGVSALLILKAFSSGSTAMTGIEAVSNDVPAFKPVEWRNARTTLTWMIILLVAMFGGTIALIHFDGVVPSGRETVLSQLAHRSFGSGAMYAFTQASTAAILLLAANTAYNDFPRVLFLLARSHHAPHVFLRIGDRLAFSNGILVLSLAATSVYVGFGGSTESLIPLFAVGVFLAFTFSQAGMVVHWWRHREAHWRKSLVLNGVGATLSAIVFVIAGLTKFTQGAWVAVLVVGLFVVVSLRIRHHYAAVLEATALHPHPIEIPGRVVTPRADDAASPRDPDASGAANPGNGAEADTESEETPVEIRHLTVVPVAVLDLPGLRALAYAASLEQPLVALHVSPSDAEAERFRGYWHTWGDHLPLEVVVSPYRVIVGPIVNYLASLHRQRPDLTVTVIMPELVVRRRCHAFLHNRTAPRLRRALRPLTRVVVTTVPFHVPC
jgi:amino acid transporter